MNHDPVVNEILQEIVCLQDLLLQLTTLLRIALRNIPDTGPPPPPPA
jgi:hypothetical protein